MKRTVEVELAGRRFRVRSDDDDRYIRELTEYVNGKLLELRRSSNLIEGEQIALLTLLDVTDALFRERARNKDLVTSVKSRSERVLALLDQLHDAAPELVETAELAVEASEQR
ncbi:MAG: cell division protein ZapA [Myxococcota bacterium]